jgi:Holliday junction resolvase
MSDERARILYEAAEQTAWSDPEQIAALAKRLLLGLPAEDEFSVIISWLGRCRLVHKLDQLQFPAASKDTYRVPDLLAVFEFKGAVFPVLVEVKVKQENKLSWRPDFMDGLKRYSDLTGLPLLVAWKNKTFWTLFEARHFKRAITNYNITFDVAIKQTLMSVLAGDFSFSLHPGVGLHLEMKKLKKTNEGWIVRIDKSYYTDADATRLKLVPGLYPLFVSSFSGSDVEETDTHLRQSFVVPDPPFSEFAHRTLGTLIWLGSGKGDRLASWRAILQGKTPPELAHAFLKAVPEAKPHNVLRSFQHIAPKDWPQFIPRKSRWWD